MLLDQVFRTPFSYFLFEGESGGAGSGGSGVGDGGGGSGGAGAGDGAGGDAGSSSAGGEGSETDPTTEIVTFDSYEALFGSLSADHQELVTGHVSGLETSLKASREDRKQESKKLKVELDALKETLSEHDAAKAEVERLSSSLATTTERMDFMEDAFTHGVENPRLAYLAFEDNREAYVDRHDEVDWEKFKESNEQLFRRPAQTTPVTTNAGAGAGGTGTKIPGKTPPAPDMNTIIRTAAGKRTS